MNQKDISLNTFDATFEFHINKIKRDFIDILQADHSYFTGDHESTYSSTHINLLKIKHQRKISNLRDFVNKNFDKFNAFACSSLSCIPTKPITEDERYIHRLWMGGSIPAIAKETITQWGSALNVIETTGNISYCSILWVWNEQQLSHDHCFSAINAPEYTIGIYTLSDHVLTVKSLSRLACDFSGKNVDIINQLHDKKYFSSLSDYFRFLIVMKFGGIYMDIDTMPYKVATVFLSKPEVPNYIHTKFFKKTGRFEQFCVSWMNLFLDETGMIIAKKNDPSIIRIFDEIENNYLRKTRNIPEKCEKFELEIFNEFYSVWKNNIGFTFLSYDVFYDKYCILNKNVKENVICGIRGMRLQHDIVTNESMPLTAEEEKSYANCIKKLEEINWHIEKPIDLEKITEIFCINEIPRMAYPAQLRSDIDHYHYYSVLSRDPYLDRVNTLFSEYLVARNSESIKNNNFWVATQGKPSKVPHQSSKTIFTGNTMNNHIDLTAPARTTLVAGKLLNEKQKNRMAELLFATSYLEYCSFSNKLNLPFVQLQRVQNIDQYIKFTYGLFDAEKKFVGFFSAGTIAAFFEHPSVSHYRDEMKEMDDAYEAFLLKNANPSDYFVCSMAIEDKFKGKGFFYDAIEEMKTMASQNNSERIVFVTWGKSDLYKIASKKNSGFSILDTFNYAYHLFFDTLYFIELKV